jgi:hypothetical protein
VTDQSLEDQAVATHHTYVDADSASTENLTFIYDDLRRALSAALALQDHELRGLAGEMHVVLDHYARELVNRLRRLDGMPPARYPTPAERRRRPC